MTRWLLVIGLWAMLAGTAGAMCSQQTIFLPDGRVMICQTCGSSTYCY